MPTTDAGMPPPGAGTPTAGADADTMPATDSVGIIPTPPRYACLFDEQEDARDESQARWAEKKFRKRWAHTRSVSNRTFRPSVAGRGERRKEPAREPAEESYAKNGWVGSGSGGDLRAGWI